MSNTQQPHIGLLIDESFPDIILERFQTELYHPSLNVAIKKARLGGPYNSLEWAIPTAIGVYILKPFFESFLKEAGKDFYDVFKKWVKKTSNDTRSIKVHTISSTQSKDKLQSNNSQSKVFSIQIISNDQSHNVKFLFDEDLPQEVWDKAIDNLFLLLEKHYSLNSTDEISVTIKRDNLHRSVWAIIKSDTGEWELLDYKKFIQPDK